MAFATLNRVLDDRITAMLKPYLAIGYGKDGKPYSDVIVKDGDIKIINLYAWTKTVTDELAAMGLPIAVRMLHCTEVKIYVPWFSWSTNPVEVVIDGLMAVLEPTQQSEWTLQGVRSFKESAIEEAFQELLMLRLQAATAGKKKSLFGRIKAQFWAHFRPKVSITNSHIRCAA